MHLGSILLTLAFLLTACAGPSQQASSSQGAARPDARGPSVPKRLTAAIVGVPFRLTSFSIGEARPGGVRCIDASGEGTVAFDTGLTRFLLFYSPEPIVVRKGIRALDDWQGGAEAAQTYGTYSRNAYLWDIQ